MRRALDRPVDLCSPAAAMVGGAQPAPKFADAVVMIVGSRGTSCTGTAIARDLVLTAAHCVTPGADYKLVEFDAAAAALQDVAAIARHPQFDADAAVRHRVTADVALLKLSALDVAARRCRSAPAGFGRGRRPLPGRGLRPCRAGRRQERRHRAHARRSSRPASPATCRSAWSIPATKNQRPGLGACTGDSGGPAFVNSGGALAVTGVVSWSTAAKNDERLRRAHRRHAARALSRLDYGASSEDELAARSVVRFEPAGFSKDARQASRCGSPLRCCC